LTATDVSTAMPGRLVLRPAPAGLPIEELQPPNVAEAGDPFSAVRILRLVARVERGAPVRIDDIAASLNATYLDWTFSPTVVASVVLQLQANWMTDYRNGSGIVVEDGLYGTAVTIEDSSRVDPWIVRQVEREVVACRIALEAFSQRDGTGFDD
jgi:hypothetical protein